VLSGFERRAVRLGVERVVDCHAFGVLGGLSGFGLNTVIYLQVRNDNPYDVQIRGMNVNVTFGHGYPIGPINFPTNQWLQANRTTLVAVPVTIPWVVMPALISETMGSYSIPYHVKGYADVTATRTFQIDRDNYQVDESGSLPRQMLVDSARSMLPIQF